MVVIESVLIQLSVTADKLLFIFTLSVVAKIRQGRREMKILGLLIFIAVFITGCSGMKGKTTSKTTCSPLVFTTSSTTIDCDVIKFGQNTLPEDQLQFMATTYPEISEEASQGEGDYLYALGELLKCEDSELLGQKIRSQYSTIFNQKSDPVSSLKEIHSLVENDPSLRESCSITTEG